MCDTKIVLVNVFCSEFLYISISFARIPSKGKVLPSIFCGGTLFVCSDVRTMIFDYRFPVHRFV